MGEIFGEDDFSSDEDVAEAGPRAVRSLLQDAAPLEAGLLMALSRPGEQELRRWVLERPGASSACTEPAREELLRPWVERRWELLQAGVDELLFLRGHVQMLELELNVLRERRRSECEELETLRRYQATGDVDLLKAVNYLVRCSEAEQASAAAAAAAAAAPAAALGPGRSRYSHH
jgi:hypothetical protein